VLILGVVACDEEVTNNEPSFTDIINDVTSTPDQKNVTTPTKGGTVSLSVAVYNTLNPLITNNEDIKNYMNLVFDSMVKVNFEQTVVPELCESWQMGETAAKWYFTIRAGVKWHDGTDFTNNDIKATIDWVMKNGGLYLVNVSGISSCNILEDGRIELLLKAPDMLLPNKLLFPILKENLLTSGSFNAIGTGLYKIESDAADKIVLVENTNYWSVDKPYISKVEINKYTTESDKYKSTSDIIMLSAENVYKYSVKPEYKSIKFPSRSFGFLAINNRSEQLQSANVRKAIAFCLDKENIINMALSGHGIATDWPIFPGSVYWREGSTDQTRNLAKARELLLADGYTQSEGTWSKNGKILSINCIMAPSDNEIALALQTVQTQLGECGIPLTIESLTADKLRNSTTSGQYDMAILRINISSWPNLETTVMTNQTMNIFGFSNAEIDQFFNSFNEEPVLTKQSEILKKIKLRLNESVPFIGLYLRKDALVISNKIEGPEITGISSWDPFESFAKWYVVQ